MIEPALIAQTRLRRQFLIGEARHRSAAEVVRALCAVQSQDFPGAKWAIAMRSALLDEAVINAEFDRGEIVRTHVLRPTWHFVAPEDLRWMQSLTGHRIARIMATYNARLGLTPALMRKGLRVIDRALSEESSLTRAELKIELDRARVPTEGTQRLGHLMMQAEVEGLVCSGPQRGKQQTYALVDRRIGKSRELSGDESLHELTVRYFASRAPATLHDYAWWSGLTIADCRRGIEMAGAALRSITLNGKTCFAPPDFELAGKVTASAHLLPNYDEYFIGFKDRSAIGQRMKNSLLVTGGSALIAHVVAVNGQLVGGWRRAAEHGQPVLRFDIPVELTGAERTRVKTQVARFATYVGGKVSTTGLT